MAASLLLLLSENLVGRLRMVPVQLEEGRGDTTELEGIYCYR
jgi:hypothetical protein